MLRGPPFTPTAWVSKPGDVSTGLTVSLPSSPERKDPHLIEDIVWSLRMWPLELIQWSAINSHRLDIRFNPEQDRSVLLYPADHAPFLDHASSVCPGIYTAAASLCVYCRLTNGDNFVGMPTPSSWTGRDQTMRWTRGRGSYHTGWLAGTSYYDSLL